MRLAFWSLGSLALVALVAALGPQPAHAQQPAPPSAQAQATGAAPPAAPPPPPEYTTQILVPGSWFHGVHGLAFNKDDQLFAGSVVGQAIYRVNVDSGEADEAIAPPNGMADDIAFAPDGTMAWTGFLTGEIWARKGNEGARKIASGLPGINSLAFAKDGRLFATQVFLGDALYEIDVKGEKPPRKIMENMGGLNGFDFGSDGLLYGPLWFKGEVVKIDIAKAEMTTVARGFKIPAAVNFDSTNKLYVIDTALGQLVSLNPLTEKGEPVANPQKTVVATLKPGLDNLAIDSRNRVFVTNMADNSVQLVDVKTGAARTIVEGRLAMPADIAVASEGGKETVYVADTFSLRRIDGATGKVDEIVRTHGDIHEYPLGVSVGGKNAVMTSWFSGTAHVVERATGKTVRLVKDLKAPMDAIEHADGSLYVLELGTGSLLRLVANGERTTVASGLAAPVAMAMGAGGVLYVTEVGSGTVAQIDLASGARKAVAEGLLGPEGLDVGPDGRIYVAEVGRSQVLAIDPRTGERAVVARNLSLGLPAVPGLPPSYVTTGVAVGASGAVYVSSDQKNAIYKLTPPQ